MIFISSVASDVVGEAARFRLLLGAFAGTNGKGKPISDGSQWTAACILEAIVRTLLGRAQRDLWWFVLVARFLRLGLGQGEK
jgi:hypothetical protein